MPNRRDVKNVLRKLKHKGGSLAFNKKDATPLERFRFELQQVFVTYKITHDCTQKELSELLGVDKAKISKILSNRLDEFSTDRLISLCEKINPLLRLRVS